MQKVGAFSFKIYGKLYKNQFNELNSVHVIYDFCEILIIRKSMSVGYRISIILYNRSDFEQLFRNDDGARR